MLKEGSVKIDKYTKYMDDSYKARLPEDKERKSQPGRLAKQGKGPVLDATPIEVIDAVATEYLPQSKV
jgi:hypothetical protein